MVGLKQALERLGLKQIELARLIEVSPRTVSLWATGEVALPGPVAAYLRVLQAAGPDVLAAEFARLDGRKKSFDEGVYTFSYALNGASAESGGDALAVLRSGRIIGSDRFGGVFEGSYHYDPAQQSNLFHVRVKVPPGGELVTGFVGGPDGANLDIVATLERAAPVATATIDVAGKPVDVKLTYLGPLPS